MCFGFMKYKQIKKWKKILFCFTLQKSLLFGLFVIAAVGADVSHLKGYDYTPPNPAFHDEKSLPISPPAQPVKPQPEKQYLPPQVSPQPQVSFLPTIHITNKIVTYTTQNRHLKQNQFNKRTFHQNLLQSFQLLQHQNVNKLQFFLLK